MNRSQSVSMSTTRVRDILNEIEERGSDLNVCPAEDVSGPDGGVYIARVTPLNLKHLEWMDFTVIGLKEAGMYKESGQWRATVSLDTEEAQIPRAIVGWVSARPQGVVLQATGGWTTAA